MRSIAILSTTNASRRAFIGTLAVTPLCSGCFYDNWFDLAWDEQVQLPDGRVLVVAVTHTYQRVSSGLGRFDGTIVMRDSTFAFDTGGPHGRVAQKFKGFHPMFLGETGGAWYAVIYGGYYGKSRQMPGQDWGNNDSPTSQWAIRLVGDKWEPMRMADFPRDFSRPNFFFLSGTVKEHVAYDGKLVTLQDKEAWLAKHPPAVNHFKIIRPRT